MNARAQPPHPAHAELESTAAEIVRQDDGTAELRLMGAYTFAAERPTLDAAIRDLAEGTTAVSVVDAGVTNWDSALLILLMKVHAHCLAHGISLDLSGLPQGVEELMRLATAVPEREGSRRGGTRDPFLVQTGKRALGVWDEIHALLSFLGDVTLSAVRFSTGRARYRREELWLTVQQCGPQALGIVTTISLLVGTILAFVGAVQLKMFGAEVYVANLVGIGMVMEMGALMTGIILAGRTGAAFAAQLGTMQVNEEIDALQTLGIPPIDYLVMPRMVALIIMTPVLVIYADVLGILGGAIVGIFMLDIPPALFFDQTFAMMTIWQCTQGLIKGATFGALVAMAGCLRGIQCGRSASAVGDAATSAVVTSLVLIVLADATWTLIFLTMGGGF